VYKTLEDLENDLLGLFKRDKISEARQWLASEGYIQRRRNPIHKMDNTPQCLFMPGRVQKSMAQRGLSEGAAKELS
jgi:hypothetical protein